jgi:hypothetical protein
MKSRILSKITDDTIFSINYDGWACIYINTDNCYESTNQVKDFKFRSYNNADEMDGTDFWGISEEEINNILSTFDFEKVDLG